MASILFTSILFLWMKNTNSQKLHYYPLPSVDPWSCQGSNVLNDVGIQVVWNLNEINNPEGYVLSDSGIGPTKLWRLNLCGAITAENAACNDTDTWCMEETYLNGSCVTGYANWDQESVINYYAVMNSTDPETAGVLGLRVTLTDDDEKIDKDCPDGIMTINYDIVCAEGDTVARSISDDDENCVYNVSFHSEAACVDWYPIKEPNLVEYHLTSGQDICGGSHDINDLDQTIDWEMYGLYNAEGIEKPDQNLGPSFLYRFSVCLGMQEANTICGHESALCLETTTLDKQQCIKPLAVWEEDTEASIYAVFNSSDKATAAFQGMRIRLYDSQMTTNQSQCGSEAKPTTVLYEIICLEGHFDPLVSSILADESKCEYNITMFSEIACATLKPIDNDSVIDDLSAGSILLIIFFVLAFVYIIAGCLYNGCVNGRVGMDAMPNKAGWVKLCRYAQAGCSTSKDTCCFCGGKGTNYQEL